MCTVPKKIVYVIIVNVTRFYIFTALIPHKTFVSPTLAKADPSAVSIELTFKITGRNCVKILPSGLTPLEI